MTTADVISGLTCELAVAAVAASMQHDYGISCDNDWCHVAGELWVMELMAANPLCDQSLVGRITSDGSTTINPVDTTEDCEVAIYRTTGNAACNPITIQEQ